MSTDAGHPRSKTIDPVLVEAITREVIARLRATSGNGDATATIHDRIVTADTIEQIAGKPSQLFLPANAIVTPAAIDEARRRRITIRRIAIERNVAADNQQNASPPTPDRQSPQIIDAADPARADAVRDQLSHRGVLAGSAKVLLSETPARDVYQQCTAGEVAVMIASLNDVRRFVDELSPTVWVLDMKRLNLPAAVNVIARIIQQGDRPG